MIKKKYQPITSKFLIILCSLLCWNGLFAQSNADIVVPLTRVIGIGPLYTNVKAVYKKSNSAEDCVGLPPNVQQFAIFKIGLNTDQILFDKFRQSIPLNPYEQPYFETIDTHQLSKDYIQHSIEVFSGIDHQKKVIIFDSNQNKDFSDDMRYEFDLDTNNKDSIDWNALNTTVLLNYERFNSMTKSVQKRDVVAKFYPFNISDKNDKLSFDLVSFEHRLGTFEVNDTSYHIAVATKGPFTDNFSNAEVVITKKGERFVSESNRLKVKDMVKSVGGSLDVEDKVFFLEKVSVMGDTIFLNQL